MNLALTRMDEATQQNSALVEHAAAATGSLEEQVSLLKTAMSAFRIEQQSGVAGHNFGGSRRARAMSARALEHDE